MFPKAQDVTYKAVITTRGGKDFTYNYLTEVKREGGFFVLSGQEQNDGTMVRRDFIVAEDVVAMIDVRVISASRQPSQRQQVQTAAQSVTEDVVF